ncbi:MAG: hypothetical protein M3O24_03250 [Thermoproteota archaeon]|nr:hypothetical protein [Thermoproteota archaeon]
MTICMKKLRDVVGGQIVGSGSDFVVILKGSKRILMQFDSHKLIELKNGSTPYGSDC